MDIALVDERRGGKQRRFYIRRTSVNDNRVLPDGMFVGVDDKGREAISGEPSPMIWREVSREDFVFQTIAVFGKRSNNNEM